MALHLDKVHTYVMDKDTGAKVITKVDPYIKFVSQGETPVLVQRGRFYSDGGDTIGQKDLPRWVCSKIAVMTKEGLAKVGLKPDVLDRDEPPKLGDDSSPTSLVDVIKSLDPEDDTHWTKTGLPNLPVLKRMMDTYISRRRVEEVMPNFKRPKEK